mmetsp:Transcript_35030/g.87388  ORF Transcript_35030/g.87388 Transcript_35030/m.87388 type:complete len:119 (+) Transcript_35030:287-643(+)
MVCYDGDVGRARALLETHVNLTFSDSFGVTALMCSSSQGRIECTRFLLDTGADVLAKDANGCTALSYGSRTRYGGLKVVQLLCAYGAQRKADDPDAPADCQEWVLERDVRRCVGPPSA